MGYKVNGGYILVAKHKELKFKQLVTGMFIGESGTGSYCIIGLAQDGKVYRYDTGCMGWFPLPMKPTRGCEHRR